MNSFKSIKIINSGKSINLQRMNGSNVRYHATWLRDNAIDSKTRSSSNGQRLITISDIPVNTYIESAEFDKNKKNICINFLPERKKIFFSLNWLEKYSYDTKYNKKKRMAIKRYKNLGKWNEKKYPNTKL